MRIAISAGHGLGTAGKQTWDIDGSFMHEHEFNREVANYLKSELAEHEVIFSHWSYGDLDRPLADRCAIANDFKADIFISIHANAAPGPEGIWHPASGIETYYYPTSSKGIKLAECIQNSVISNTQRLDRKIFAKRYHVLKYTKMPAILIECGFMTNQEEASLLISDAYRKNIAHAISEGVKNYEYGILYYDEVKPLQLNTWKGNKKPGSLTSYKNFINGMFFSWTGALFDWCIQDEKILSSRRPWNKKSKGTLIIYNDGKVFLEQVKDVAPSNVHMAIQGVSLSGNVLENMKKEGWLSDVNRSCIRSGIGQFSSGNLCIITIRGTLEDLQKVFIKLGCLKALGLDAGDSTARCRDGKMLIDTTRKMKNIIYWEVI